MEDFGVPQTYVLPRHLFSVERVISLADLEFPIYYNFFIKKQPITVICEADQRERVRNILKQTLFSGITNAQILPEFARGEADDSRPDLEKEIEYFMWAPHLNRRYQWHDMINFKIIKGNRPIKLGQTRITLYKKRAEFVVMDKGETLGTVPWNLPVTTPHFESIGDDKTFQPPLFGVSVLGRSDGFDPTAPTSGFVFWIDGRGIMVDPPVDSTLKLKSRNVSPKLINDVILTHVHSDHDAGLLQKIFEEGKVNLYTTQNIFDSFLCKAEHLTKYHKSELQNLINYKPLRIGVPTAILGAKFYFRYSLHPVPTIQLEIYFQGKSLFYTGDHVYDPDKWKELYEQGILTKGRYEALLNTPWHHDMILHEAGIPPTHTPMKRLIELDETIKERVYLVHVGDKSLPQGTNLKLAPDSIENFLSIPVDMPRYHESSKILRILSNIDFLSDFPVSKLIDMLPFIKWKHFPADKLIMKQGDPGDDFHIVVDGKIGIIRDDTELIVYGPNDYYGEMAVISGDPRSANVVAKSDVLALVISKEDFLAFIEGTHVMEYLQKINETRRRDSYPLLESSPVFGFLTPTQIAQMQAIMTYISIPKGEILINQGDPFTHGYIISDGIINITKNGDVVYRLGRGSFIGELDLLLQNRKHHHFKAVTASNTNLYQVERQPLKRFITNHSGVRVRLLHYGKYTSQALHFEYEQNESR